MAISLESVEASVRAATDALLSEQNPDGHWRYDLETFVFTPAFHIVTLYYANEKMDLEVQEKIGINLRRHQLASGGWGFVPHGEQFLSNSVITYFALRLIGDQPNEEHMLRARRAILKAGGAEGINIMTRYFLVLFGIIPWSCVPCVPVEIILLPDWFPFTLYKVSYWARVTLVPMMVLHALDKRPKQDFKVNLEELFRGNPAEMKLRPRLPAQSRVLYTLFGTADKILKFITPYIPAGTRSKAISNAVAFCKERLNGVNGYASLIPAMLYILMMYDALDYAEDHPDRVLAREALSRFVVVREKDAYTVSCLCPTWDTTNVMTALLDTEDSRAVEAVEKALEYLRPKQILDVKGDWAHSRPNVRPGGWAFFYENPHYPDPEDTAGVVLGMYRAGQVTGSDRDKTAISRGVEWIIGMQSQNGGWASFDADNTYYYLDNIPAASDCGSFLDPPTVDVTSSIVDTLSRMGQRQSNSETVRRAVKFILDMQKPNGSWLGRWGVNYVYGTRQALCALTSAGLPLDHPSIVKGLSWLLSVQNEDGGWGEGIVSYNKDVVDHVIVPSTASQTSWGLLGLLSALDADHPAITAGVKYLLKTQRNDGQWYEEEYTGTGHPDLIMCRYHGYPKYFPLQALARYCNKMKLKRMINSQHI